MLTALLVIAAAAVSVGVAADAPATGDLLGQVRAVRLGFSDGLAVSLVHASSPGSFLGRASSAGSFRDEAMHVAFVVGDVPRGSLQFENLNELHTMLRSVLAYRSGKLHFHVFIREAFHQKLMDDLSGYVSKCTEFTFHPLEPYILIVQEFLNTTRFDTVRLPFGMMKLFVPLAFSRTPIEEVFVMDTDMVLLNDIRNLFDEADRTKVMGLTCVRDAHRYRYYCSKNNPRNCRRDEYCTSSLIYYNLNQILLLGLNDWREFITQETSKMVSEYTRRWGISDQVIFNRLYGQYENLTFTFGCNWNCYFTGFFDFGINAPQMPKSCQGHVCSIIHYNEGGNQKFFYDFISGFSKFPLSFLKYDKC